MLAELLLLQLLHFLLLAPLAAPLTTLPTPLGPSRRSLRIIVTITTTTIVATIILANTIPFIVLVLPMEPVPVKGP